MKHAKILGTGSYLPKKILTNSDLEKMVDTTDEWILKRVGIKKRHICADGETTVSMAAEAAKNALAAAGLEADAIDLIVVGTATPDKQFPSSACLLQRELGMARDIPAFDLNAACSGFIYSLSVAEKFIKTGSANHVLVVGVDALSRVTDWTDRSTCVLFGDGAGAVVLSASDEPGVINTHLGASGEYADLIWADNHIWQEQPDQYVHMSGNQVFKLAVNKLGNMIDQGLVGSGLSKEDVDWLIPHQANLRIIQAAAKKLDLPMERVVLTVEEHGNTSAASIPLALDYGVRNGQVKRGEVLFLEAFGAGLSWGSALVVY